MSIGTREKLEKLTRVSLHKNWDAQLFVKFVAQLRDSSDDQFDGMAAAEAILTAHKSKALNLMVLEYLSALVIGQSSILSMHEVLDYCQSTDSIDEATKSTIIVFLGQRLRFLRQNAASDLEKLMKSATNYMDKLQLSQPESAALVCWLKKLATSGLIQVGSEGTSTKDFKTALTRFSKSLDTATAIDLRTAFARIWDDGVDELAGTSRISRVQRLIWLDRVVRCQGRIQEEGFQIELKPLLANLNTETVVRELIITSFDCYAIAQLNKSFKYLSLWRAFIVKRLPTVIKTLAESEILPMESFESWICQPLQYFDRGTINLIRIAGGGDAMDEMFSSFPSTTSDIRHEFLTACMHTELINAESMRKALGQEAASMSEEIYRGKPGSDFILDQNGLEVPIEQVIYEVSQENAEYISFNDSAILRLISTFEEVDGARQSKIATKLLQLLSDWLSTKNTRGLRRLCQALCNRLGAVDSLLVHIQPLQILVPLTQHLDKWASHAGAEEDSDGEGDLQETFTDFGCILLFIVLVVNRYDLELGSLGSDGFVINVLDPARSTIQSMETLSQEQKDLVGEWIVALYDSGGIGDDLMKNTSVQDMLVLVPHIFQQSIFARSKNIIDAETLKGGLEYFLQPFLLGTLFVAFKYLCLNLWESKDPTVPLQVVQCLTVPSGMSDEAIAIHGPVMSVIAPGLRRCLDGLESTTNSSMELSQISSAISQYVEEEKQAPLPSLTLAVKEQISGLTNWAQACERGHVSGPPFYKPELITEAIETLGAHAVVQIFLDELDLAEAQGTFETTLDVVASIILVFDTIHAEQRFYKPTRKLLDSSMITIVRDYSEPELVKLRAKGDAFDTSVLLVGHRKLKKRVEKLMKQADAVVITAETNAGVSPPPLPPPGSIDESTAQAVYAQAGQSEPDAEIDALVNQGGGGDGADTNMGDFDQLMELDMDVGDPNLFGDDLLMDMS